MVQFPALSFAEQVVEYDVPLSAAVSGFLRNWVQGNPRTEASFHSRNDHFIRIIQVADDAVKR